MVQQRSNSLFAARKRGFLPLIIFGAALVAFGFAAVSALDQWRPGQQHVACMSSCMVQEKDCLKMAVDDDGAQSLCKIEYKNCADDCGAAIAR